MDPDDVGRIEHLALNSHLQLPEFCSRFCSLLDLPKMSFDSENETEWGLVQVECVEYNVSRPYEKGTLTKWDDSVPEDCTFGISLLISAQHPKVEDDGWGSELAASVAVLLANHFGSSVYYHRTWSQEGNVSRSERYPLP